MISLNDYVNEHQPKQPATSEEPIPIENIIAEIQNTLEKLKGESYTIDARNMGKNEHIPTTGMYSISEDDGLIVNTAGYLIEILVWNALKDLNPGKLHRKGWYDFHIPEGNKYCEVKARSIRKGKSGGIKYTANQKQHKDELIFIHVYYIINGGSIKIDEVEVVSHGGNNS